MGVRRRDVNAPEAAPQVTKADSGRLCSVDLNVDWKRRCDSPYFGNLLEVLLLNVNRQCSYTEK